MNKILWLVPLLLLSACSSQQPAENMIQSIAATRVYECGEFEFVTRDSSQGLTLYMPEDSLVMEEVLSATGSKYKGGGVILHVKDNEAMLDLGYRSYTECRLNIQRGPWEDARRRGVQFRATGQEPGWFLEIKPGQQILLVGDYGGSRYLFDAPEPALNSGTAIYRAQNDQHQLSIEINTDWCQDSMSGQVFSNRVVLNLDGRELHGCGEAFEDEWR